MHPALRRFVPLTIPTSKTVEPELSYIGHGPWRAQCHLRELALPLRLGAWAMPWPSHLAMAWAWHGTRMQLAGTVEFYDCALPCWVSSGNVYTAVDFKGRSIGMTLVQNDPSGPPFRPSVAGSLGGPIYSCTHYTASPSHIRCSEVGCMLRTTLQGAVSTSRVAGRPSRCPEPTPGLSAGTRLLALLLAHGGLRPPPRSALAGPREVGGPHDPTSRRLVCACMHWLLLLLAHGGRRGTEAAVPMALDAP